MAISITVALLVGTLLGWAACRRVYLQRTARHVLREADECGTKADKLIAELDAHHGDSECMRQTADAELDLVVLAKLDSGEISEAKRGLIFKVGRFYHKWTTTPDRSVPAEVQKLLQITREAAENHESVRAAVSYKPEA